MGCKSKPSGLWAKWCPLGQVIHVCPTWLNRVKNSSKAVILCGLCSWGLVSSQKGIVLRKWPLRSPCLLLTNIGASQPHTCDLWRSYYSGEEFLKIIPVSGYWAASAMKVPTSDSPPGEGRVTPGHWGSCGVPPVRCQGEGDIVRLLNPI